MFTGNFAQYVAPARGHPQIWRLVLGTILIVVVYLVCVALLFLVIYLLTGGARTSQIAVDVANATTPTGMFLLFASFLGAALGPFLAVRLLHKRTIGTLFGPRTKVLRDFIRAAVAVMTINAGLLVLLSFWISPIANLPFSIWIALLPLTIVGVLVQTAAEELVFRGYLQQQLAARFHTPLIWMVLPCAGFAALHYDPSTAGQNTWLIVGATGMYGLIAADLTRITGSLGAAWGFHFANNIWAIVLLAVDGSITGLSLYVTPYSADDTTILPKLIIADVLVMLVVWIVLRRRLQR